MDDWIDQNAPGNNDLLLQMDIEGSEWSVLLNVAEVEGRADERIFEARPTQIQHHTPLSEAALAKTADHFMSSIGTVANCVGMIPALSSGENMTPRFLVTPTSLQ